MLAQIDDLSLLLWNYIRDPDAVQHVSPLAEEFFATFQLGADPQHISPLDIAGIGVAGVQALHDVMSDQNERIAYLSSIAGIEFQPLSGAALVAATGVAADSQAASGSEGGSQSFVVLEELNVFNDDVIVDGSLCVGADCHNGESFGFDTIRIADDEISIHFQDTSTQAGFPSNDWRIVTNDEGPGAAGYIAIVDAETGNAIFRVDEGSADYSLLVDALGQVGIGTSTPAQALHVAGGDTPTIRLEQSGGAFGDASWDVSGNELGWSVRDVSGGTTPFRVQSGGARCDVHG